MAKVLAAAAAIGGAVGLLYAVNKRTPVVTAGATEDVSLTTPGGDVLRVQRENAALRASLAPPKAYAGGADASVGDQEAALLTDAALAADPRARKQQELAQQERARALAAAARAEELAAKSAAAVAAATALRDKEAEDAERREALERIARDLEEASRAKAEEAKRLKSLLKEDHRSLSAAEKQAEVLLDEQEVSGMRVRTQQRA